MAKFHINKHGVPAPCKAQKGNCPYGGEESHYNSQEEAQIAIDQINEEEYGVLGGLKKADNVVTLELKSSAKDVSDLFVSEPYNNHGYVVVGIHTTDFMDLPEYNKVAKEVWDNLPDKWKNEENPCTIIPERNVEAFFECHVFNKYSDAFDEKHYQALANEVSKRCPEFYDKEENQIDWDLISHMSKFGARRSMETPQLIINGDKYMVADYEAKNWAKDYFDSGEFKNFKK